MKELPKGLTEKSGGYEGSVASNKEGYGAIWFPKSLFTREQAIEEYEKSKQRGFIEMSW